MNQKAPSHLDFPEFNGYSIIRYFYMFFCFYLCIRPISFFFLFRRFHSILILSYSYIHYSFWGGSFSVAFLMALVVFVIIRRRVCTLGSLGGFMGLFIVICT